jgi:Phage integrase family
MVQQRSGRLRLLGASRGWSPRSSSGPGAYRRSPCRGGAARGATGRRLHGRPLHPERFSKWFEQHTRTAGLPKIRLHDVRHSYATAALAAGIPAKVVSERLGHANIAITMDTYSHVLPGLDAEAAGTVARLILGGARRERSAAVKPLSSGRKAARRRKEVKGETPGQDWGDRGDSNPRPSGPQPDALTN